MSDVGAWCFLAWLAGAVLSAVVGAVVMGLDNQSMEDFAWPMIFLWPLVVVLSLLWVVFVGPFWTINKLTRLAVQWRRDRSLGGSNDPR